MKNTDKFEFRIRIVEILFLLAMLAFCAKGVFVACTEDKYSALYENAEVENGTEEYGNQDNSAK